MSEEHTTQGLLVEDSTDEEKTHPNKEQTQDPNAVLEGDDVELPLGQNSNLVAGDPDAEKFHVTMNMEGGSQGVIKLNIMSRFHKTHGQKATAVQTQKKRRRWLCEQYGFPSNCKAHDNFLNLTADEMEQIKNRQEILAMKKEAHFRKMFSSYITGIIGDEGIMKEMNDLVAKYDYNKAKRKWRLYQHWHRKVFDNINEQVDNKLQTMTSDKIKEKLRYFHYKYMESSNSRLLFRDIIDNSFYNPFESLKHTVKYKVCFSDPLKYNIDKDNLERLVRGEVIITKPVTREILDTSKWNYAAFRSTIWGHLNADEEDGSHMPIKNTRKWASDDLLHNVRFVGKQYWNEEFPRGKYIVPNQGKGWSFRVRHEGKAKVYGLECLTQPKLQLYYN